MTHKELLFWALLIKQGADEITRRICEDMSEEAYNVFTDEEKQRMAELYEKWNSDGRDEAWFFTNAGLWLCFLAARFRYLAEHNMSLTIKPEKP